MYTTCFSNKAVSYESLFLIRSETSGLLVMVRSAFQRLQNIGAVSALVSVNTVSSAKP